MSCRAREARCFQSAKRIQVEVELVFVAVNVRFPKEQPLALDEWLESQGGARLTSSDTGDIEP